MKKMFSGFIGVALLFSLNIPARAHDPPDYLGFVWQWPANKTPVLDANLSEWEIIPSEYWVTSDQANKNGNTASDRADGYDGDLDASSLSYKWIPSFVEGQSRLWWAHERFDDNWMSWDDIEIAVDADHSGGTFWDLPGQSDEEIQRQRGRHAQIYHLYFDDGLNRGPGLWSWFWMTQADWYDKPPYSDKAYKNTGTPGSYQENVQKVELWQVYWDDYNWKDPVGSVQHNFAEGEIIGIATNVWDYDPAAGTQPGEGCQCVGRWSLSPNVESFGDADYFADFLLLPIDEDIMATAVENDSWGAIKASLAR